MAQARPSPIFLFPFYLFPDCWVCSFFFFFFFLFLELSWLPGLSSPSGVSYIVVSFYYLSIFPFVYSFWRGAALRASLVRIIG